MSALIGLALATKATATLLATGTGHMVAWITTTNGITIMAFAITAVSTNTKTMVTDTITTITGTITNNFFRF